MSFLFILGRTTQLCLLELTEVLQARFPSSALHVLTPSLVSVEGITKENAMALQEILGGTIKIAIIKETIETKDTKSIEEKLALLIESDAKESKCVFAVGEFERNHLQSISLSDIKDLLEEKGVSSRYVEADKEGLSASVLLHKKVTEYLVASLQEETIIATTLTVQNIDQWTRRDRGRPYADRRHGMMPSKVSRMMINLALPKGPPGKLLDPFCGTGTTLIEGMDLGFDVFGCDIRSEAVSQAKGNTQWLLSASDCRQKAIVFLLDATKVSQTELGGEVDAVVAEGYLGPQTPQEAKVPNLFKGLEKLYLGAFKQWTHILPQGGRVVLALPKMQIRGKTFSLESLVDRLSGLGYNTKSTPVIYERPGAVVQRQIFVLEYRK